MRSALLPGLELHQSPYSKILSNAMKAGKGDGVSLSPPPFPFPGPPLLSLLPTPEYSLQLASLLFLPRTAKRTLPKTSGRNLFNIYQLLQQLK